MDEIVVVGLEINKNDSGFMAFESKSAKEKIEIIRDRIIAIAKQLETSHPDAMWVVGWREYGINDGPLARAIPPDMKEFFKDEMEKLVQQFPKLVILAGTVSTYKTPDPQVDPTHAEAKLRTIDDTYKNQPWLQYARKQEDIVEEKIGPEDSQVKRHHEQVTQAIASEEPTPIVRNTAFCFQKDKTQHHDKTTPLDEIKSKQFESAVYQPGKDEHAQPYFYVRHPISGNIIMLGAEICRENTYHILQQASPDKRPLIHFVISDETKCNLADMYGDYFVQFDSRVRPHLVTTKNAQPSNIHLYSNDVTASNTKLSAPYQAMYPFELQIQDNLLAAIQAAPPSHKVLLQDIYNEFLEIRESKKGGVIYDFLDEAMDKLKSSSSATPSSASYFDMAKSIMGNMYSSIWQKPKQNAFDIKMFVDGLTQLVTQQRQLHPNFKDICSYEHSLPFNPAVQHKQTIIFSH